MIVLDTSALLAILQREPERAYFINLIAAADRRLISVLTVYEAAIVMLVRRGSDAMHQLFEYLEFIEAEHVSFDFAQVREATKAYVIYGKSLNADARLNLCDCAAYALAKSLNAPLLFKGYDFAHTDVLRCA